MDERLDINIDGVRATGKSLIFDNEELIKVDYGYIYVYYIDRCCEDEETANNRRKAVNEWFKAMGYELKLNDTVLSDFDEIKAVEPYISRKYHTGKPIIMHTDCEFMENEDFHYEKTYTFKIKISDI